MITDRQAQLHVAAKRPDHEPAIVEDRRIPSDNACAICGADIRLTARGAWSSDET